MSEANGTFMDYRRPRKQATRDAEQERIDLLARAHGLGEPVLAYPLAGKLACDLCWPEHDLAVVALSGNLVRDLRRVNAAALDGWLCVVVTPGQLQDGSAFALAAKVVAAV